MKSGPVTGMVMLLRMCVSFLTSKNLCQNTDMSQDEAASTSRPRSGYLLKEASSALRAAMEAVLRPLGMTVTHYSCLELLAQRPGLSNSELARGAFVTRQSMNVLLQALERDGYRHPACGGPRREGAADAAHARSDGGASSRRAPRSDRSRSGC